MKLKGAHLRFGCNPAIRWPAVREPYLISIRSTAAGEAFAMGQARAKRQAAARNRECTFRVLLYQLRNWRKIIEQGQGSAAHVGERLPGSMPKIWYSVAKMF